MSKYLIIQCKELSDQYECDANKTPIKITNDCSKYGNGYEVWEILENGNLKKIKEYGTILEEGFAIYFWGFNEDEPCVVEKFKNLTRKNITKSMIKNIKKQYGFVEPTEDIFDELQSSGHHAEMVNKRFLFFGEYSDNNYSHY